MASIDNFLETLKYVEGKNAVGELLSEQLDYIVYRAKHNTLDTLVYENIEIESILYQVERLVNSGFDTEFYLGNIKMVSTPGPNNTFRVECDDKVYYPMAHIVSQEGFDIDRIEDLGIAIATGIQAHMESIVGNSNFYILYGNYIKRFNGMDVKFVDGNNSLRFFKSVDSMDVISIETGETLNFFAEEQSDEFFNFVSLLKSTIVANVSTQSKEEMMKEFHQIMSKAYTSAAASLE